MKINNEIDLLNLLIKSMDKNHRCLSENVNITKYIDTQTMCNYLKILKDEGFISFYIGGEYEIHDKGISFIKQNTSCTRIINPILKWALGIISALVIAFLIYIFGLN